LDFSKVIDKVHKLTENERFSHTDHLLDIIDFVIVLIFLSDIFELYVTEIICNFVFESNGLLIVEQVVLYTSMARAENLFEDVEKLVVALE
jgi:hypothetical protein